MKNQNYTDDVVNDSEDKKTVKKSAETKSVTVKRRCVQSSKTSLRSVFGPKDSIMLEAFDRCKIMLILCRR